MLQYKEDSKIGYIINSMRIPIIYYILALLLAFILSCIRGKWEGALFGYCFLVFASTVLNRASRNFVEYDFRILKSVFVNYNLLQQAIPNVIMFIPIGIITAKLHYSPILIGAIFSIVIETMQLIFHKGVFEFDDIIANIFGAFVGEILYFSITYLYDKTKKNRLPLQ